MKYNKSLVVIFLFSLSILTACGGGSATGGANPSTGNEIFQPHEVSSKNLQTLNVLSRVDVNAPLVTTTPDSITLSYTAASGRLSGRHLQFFLNVDNDPNTGFRFNNEAWDKAGTDYIVEDGHLFKSTANDTSWSWNKNVGQVSYRKTASSVSVTIKKSLLQGLKPTVRIGLMARNANWDVKAIYPRSSLMAEYTLDITPPADSVAPVISLNGSSTLVIQQGSNFTDPGATAKDNVDGDMTNQILVDSNVDTTQTGRYRIIYSATDNAGNTGKATRTVKVVAVVPDGIAIDGNKSDWADIPDTSNSSAGIIKATNKNGKLYLMIEVSNMGKNTQIFLDTDNNSTTGFQFGGGIWNQGGADYLIENTHLDKAKGNSSAWSWDYDIGAIETARSGNIIEVAIPTNLLANIGNAINIGFVNRDAQWNVISAVPETGLVRYTLSQTPPADSVAPVISLNGSSTLVIQQGSNFTDPGATAKDNVDGDMTNQILVDSNVDTTQTGRYRIIYSATDNAGNTGKATRTVKVVAVVPNGIAIDGNKSDWADIPDTSNSSAGIIKATNKNGKLYLMIEVSNMGKNTQIFLDTDNNSTTGFQFGGGIWNQGGADYLIENTHLDKAKGNSSTWSWDYNIGTIETARSGNIVEVAIPTNLLANIGNTINIGFVNRDAQWNVISAVPETGLVRYTLSQTPPPPPSGIDVPVPIAPSGNISNTTPGFSWKAVTNATEYILGLEENNTSSWQKYILSPTDINCQNPNQICTFTASNNPLNVGDNISWWVRAKVAGSLRAWSKETIFTVTSTPTRTGILINEVLSANTQTNLDPDFFEFSDWIELYNPSNQDVDISGYGLSDNNNPLQWKFPNGTIVNANDYLLVWADKQNTKLKALHTSFKLSSKKGKLTLAKNNGVIIDTLDYKKQNSDISATKQNGNIVFMSPTPGALNSVVHVSKDRSTKPNFSFDSGFYDNAISVILSQANNADIYYTLDGSTPDQNSRKYSHAINVSSTTVIRAVALEANGFLSEVSSKTYFINHTTTLPVISLTTDPDYLFDPATGIYTDGDGTNGRPLIQCDDTRIVPKNYAQDWERPAHIEYFSANGQSEFLFTAGISITGQCSREIEKKSFSVELGSKYGFKSLGFKLYNDKNLNQIKDFKLRAGADGYRVNDILAAAVVNNGSLNIDYQAYRTTQMFVNGHYWGLYNIREKKGGDFIQSNYPLINKKKLDIINQGFEAKKGDTNDYFALQNLLNSLNYDLTNDTDYQQVTAMIDEDNYIDYMALMIYSANTDWIGSNQRSWKEKKAGAKWRWMLDDVDSGFQNRSVGLNEFDVLSQWNSSNVMAGLFQSLIKNKNFKQKFKTRFITLLDTTFSPDNMISLVNTIIDGRKDYIPLENPVWNSITSVDFNRHVKSLNDFVKTRSNIVRNQLAVFLP